MAGASFPNIYRGLQGLACPMQNTTSTLDRATREGLTHDAAAALVSQIDPLKGPGTGLPVPDVTSIYAALSIQDYYSGNTTWSSLYTNLQAFNNQFGLYGVLPARNGDALYWGLAFYYSYRTYKQQFLLDLAKNAYDTSYLAGFITPSAAASSSGAGRNVSFVPPLNCTGGTFAGGMFFSKGVQNSTSISMQSVGPFMALSAYLYEATNSATYQEAAQLSVDFVANHMWNGTIFGDTFYLSNCVLDLNPLTINQAWFIEGLSVWASVTKNDTLTSLLKTVVPSVTTFTKWSLQDGVITENSAPDEADATFKSIFVRGLAEAYARNPGTDLADYIAAYINIQYNALLENARSPAPNSSYYSTSWYAGPPGSSFSAVGSIAALDVLNAAVTLVSPTTNSSTGSPTSTGGSGAPTSPNKPSRPANKTSHAGAIAGGVVGGFAVLAVIAALCLCHRRRSRTTDDYAYPDKQEATDNVDAANMVEPFTLPLALSASRPSKWQRFFEPRSNDALSSTAGQPRPGSASTPPHEEGRVEAVDPGQTRETAAGSGRADQQEAQIGTAEYAEVPTLIRRLNALLRGRPEEPPPQYEN